MLHFLIEAVVLGVSANFYLIDHELYYTAYQVNPEFFMLSSISQPNIDGFYPTIHYYYLARNQLFLRKEMRGQ